MALTNLVVRLAVGNAEGPNSATLRIWSPTGKSDVYASVRERGADFKVSLHESGECNAGLTSEFAGKEAAAVTAMGGSRHQSRWIRAKHTGLRVVTPVQFAFPASELRKWKRQPTEDKKVTWIDPPSPGHSIIVSILFSGQELPDDKWPGAANGTHLVDSKLLPNGEKLWLLWQDCPTSMHEQTLLSETREIMRQREPVRFSTITDDSPPGPRTLVFKEFKQDGFLLVLDAATDSFASTPSYQDLGKKIETTVNGEGLHMTEVTKIRWGWLRFMYGYTILGAGGFGLAILTMPDKMRGAVRWPGDEPIALSIVGSVYLAFGVLSVFGLREPLKFVPVLLLQLCYKLAWFIGAVVPLLLSGRFPSYAVVTAVIFATYVVGDLIAIPFSYVLSSHGRPHSDA